MSFFGALAEKLHTAGHVVFKIFGCILFLNILHKLLAASVQTGQVKFIFSGKIMVEKALIDT